MVSDSSGDDVNFVQY